MLDGILAEREGIPAVVICTEKFMEQGKAMASLHGWPHEFLLQVSHPIASASEEKLEAEARRVESEVVERLTYFHR